MEKKKIHSGVRKKLKSCNDDHLSALKGHGHDFGQKLFF